MKLSCALPLLALFTFGCDNGPETLTEDNCADGYDNDFDGATDCDDDDCFATLACNPDTGPEETGDTGKTDTNETQDYEWTALSSDYPKLTGEESEDSAGFAVAGGRDLNGDGNDDIVIGAYLKEGHDGTATQLDAGAVYIKHGPVTSGGSLGGADGIYLFDNDSSWFGWSLELPGDLTGNGIEDIVVGAPQSNNSGMAYILPGNLTGTSGVLDLEGVIKLYGDDPGEYAGYDLASGDVNGDGQVDLAVSADRNSFNHEESGRVYLIHGPIDGKVNLDDADAGLAGEKANDRAGRAVDILDLNGDGNDDLVIGAYHYDNLDMFDAGAAYLVYGPVPGHTVLSSADMRWDGEEENDFAGSMIEAAGDVDGDGYDDVLIGAYQESAKGSWSGAVYLIKGQSGRYSGEDYLYTAAAKLMGSNGNDWAGQRASAAGDVNGDGRDDILVGAHGWDRDIGERGAAFVVTGPIDGVHELKDYSLMAFLGESRDDQAGLGLGMAGDHNGDGEDDVLISAPSESSAGMNAGAVYLVSGL